MDKELMVEVLTDPRVVTSFIKAVERARLRSKARSMTIVRPLDSLSKYVTNDELLQVFSIARSTFGVDKWFFSRDLYKAIDGKVKVANVRVLGILMHELSSQGKIYKATSGGNLMKFKVPEETTG